jgi:putative addiction module CopG family antidote
VYTFAHSLVALCFHAFVVTGYEQFDKAGMAPRRRSIDILGNIPMPDCAPRIEMAMLIHLPTHLKSFVEQEVASGRYASEEQVIAEALERFAEEPYETMTVEEAVAEARAQVARGEARELTDVVFNEILELSENDANRGVPVRDDVRY